MTSAFFPATVVVEPTNKCNLACTFCEANCSVNGHLPKIDLSAGDLEIALEKLRPHIVNVVLQGDCEPTLNPALPDLAAVAARRAAGVAVVTNGTRADEPYLRQLIEAGVGTFAFSIDDHRPAVFERLRRPASLERVLGNLRRLVQIRDQERPDLHVIAHKIVFPEDDAETIKAYVRALYRDVGVSQITCAPLIQEGDVKSKSWLSLRNQVESELFEEDLFVNLRDFAPFPYRTLHKYCGTHLHFIDHRGNLSPCTLHVRQGRNFGNLVRQPLAEIAADPRFREFHAFWQARRYQRPFPSHCEDCFLLKGNYHRYTLNEGHARGLRFAVPEGQGE
jgi:radical SAM protein with 4Fe4S-binding SPASM domain